MKKALSLSLAVIMLFALLAGCAQSGGTAAATPTSGASTQAPSAAATDAPAETEKPAYAFPLANGDVTLEWWFSLADDIIAYIDPEFSENYAWSTLQELSGVNIKFVTPSTSTATEQFNLLIASDDYPDMMRAPSTGYPGGGDKSVDDGVFLRLNELIDAYAPDYDRWRHATDDIAKTTITDVGNIYQMQMIFDTRQAVIFGPMVRQDWLDDLGLDLPETISDWETVLTSFKDKVESGAGPLSIGKTGFNTFETFGGSAWGVGGSNNDLSFILKDTDGDGDTEVTYSAL